MPRLDRLPQITRNNLLTFPAQVDETTPFAADLAERPADPALPNFIRYCSDDLKTLFFEGYTGQFLSRVRDRLDASDDPRAKAAAFGAAR